MRASATSDVVMGRWSRGISHSPAADRDLADEVFPTGVCELDLLTWCGGHGGETAPSQALQRCTG